MNKTFKAIQPLEMHKLEDLKVLKRSPDQDNVKIGQSQLRLIIQTFLFYHIRAWWPFWSSDLKQISYFYCFIYRILHMKCEFK